MSRTLVFDNGAGSLKAGTAGQLRPSHIMPNCTAKVKGQVRVNQLDLSCCSISAAMRKREQRLAGYDSRASIAIGEVVNSAPGVPLPFGLRIAKCHQFMRITLCLSRCLRGGAGQMNCS